MNPILKLILDALKKAENQNQPLPGTPGLPPLATMLSTFANSDVAEAIKIFPGPVFVQWLHFRRHAADVMRPDWQDHSIPEAVAILDECSREMARLN